MTRALLASILVHSTQIPMMRLERDYLNVYREREHGPAGRLLDVVRGRGAAQEPLNGVAVLISSKRPMPLLLQRLCKQSVIPIVFDDDWWTFDDARSVVEYWNKTMAQQKAGVSHIHTVVIVSHGPVGGFQLVKDSKMDVRHAFEDYYHDVGKDAKRKDVMEAEEQYKWSATPVLVPCCSAHIAHSRLRCRARQVAAILQSARRWRFQHRLAELRRGAHRERLGGLGGGCQGGVRSPARAGTAR